MLDWFPSGIKIKHTKDYGVTGNFNISIDGKTVHSKKGENHTFLEDSEPERREAVRDAVAEALKAAVEKRQTGADYPSRREIMLTCEPISMAIPFTAELQDQETKSLRLINDQNRLSMGYIPPSWDGSIAYKLEHWNSSTSKKYRFSQTVGVLSRGEASTIKITKRAGHTVNGSDQFLLLCMRVEKNAKLLDLDWGATGEFAPERAKIEVKAVEGEVKTPKAKTLKPLRKQSSQIVEDKIKVVDCMGLGEDAPKPEGPPQTDHIVNLACIKDRGSSCKNDYAKAALSDSEIRARRIVSL